MATTQGKKVVSIKEASKTLKIRTADLKQFEREGVFEYYDELRSKLDTKNFERLKVAISLKRELGVNSAGIDVILNMRDKMSHMQGSMIDIMVGLRKKLGNKLFKNLKELEKLLK